MEKGLGFILLFLMTVALHGQEAISGNGKALAVIDGELKDAATGKNYFQCKVYAKPQKTLIGDFSLKLGTKGEIDSLGLSFNGKILYVKSGDDIRLFNTRTGVMLYRTNEPYMRIAMANHDNFFVVSHPEYVRAYDCYTGEQLMEYQIANNNKITKLEVTEDDAHIVATSGRNQIIFWEVGKEKPKKKVMGTKVVLADRGKTFTVTRESGTMLNIYRYSLPTFKRISRVNIDKILRDYAREQTVAIRLRDPAKRRVIIPPSKMLPSEYFLSYSGQYMALLAKSTDKEKELYIIDNNTGEVKMKKVVGGLKQPVEISWYNDSLVIPLKAVQPKIFNAKRGQFQNNLDADEISSFKNGKQKEGIFLSEDFKYKVSPEVNGFLLSQTNGKTYRLNGMKFLGFAKSSKYLYLEERGTKKRGYMLLDGTNKITWFSEEKVELNENEHLGEYQLPADYEYQRIIGFKDIADAKEEDSLKIVMKSVITGKKAGMELQIVDKNGYHYYGAGSEIGKKIWCNLMVKGSNGKVKQIKDFTVTEHRQLDTLPYAFALVLDFSGSMGWAKADALQEGAEKFILDKKPRDEFAILKYDHEITQEIALNRNTDKLMRRLYRTDFSSYGGSTALLDAINSGIFAVKKAKNVGRKVVVVFTDGMENSSISTKNEVLANALENDVNIITIGYGEMVNKSYLKTLAYNSQGGHYQIYNSNDFDWIFDDIYKKSLNYYSVQYDTQDKGSQVYMLKICHDKISSDSMMVKFENDKLDVDLLWESDEIEVNNPVANKVSLSEWDDFTYPNLTSFDGLKMEQPGIPKREVMDKDEVTQMEDEFMQLELPRFNFHYDETNTIKDVERRIQELITFMKKYKNVQLLVIGHTDNNGTLEYNDKLAMDRAEIVKKMIVDAGGDAQRLICVGYGETAPIASNNSPEGRLKNRRVEFRIKD